MSTPVERTVHVYATPREAQVLADNRTFVVPEDEE